MIKEKEYHELMTALKKTLLLEKNKEKLKQGDTALITQGENILIGTINKKTEEKTSMKKFILYAPKKNQFWAIRSGQTPSFPTQTINAHYKTKNPEQIKKTIQETPLDVFSNILEEIKQTPEYKFLEMDQTLPIKLEDMEPEKRLKLSKKLEEILIKETQKTKTDQQEINNTKNLLKYAQRIGVTSDVAKQTYKEKQKKLKKENHN